MSRRLGRGAGHALRAAFGAAAATLAAGASLLACSMPEPPNRVALVYGVSTYIEGGSSVNLSLTDDDARAMGAMLSAKGWSVTTRVADSSVATTNEQASRDRIEADIAALAGFDGIVLFYYSGHGAYDVRGESAICPYGSILATGEGYFFDLGAMITASELRAMFEAAGLGRVVIMLDSCNSGGFVAAGATTDAIPDSYGVYDDDIAYTWFVGAFGDAVAAFSYDAEPGYVVLSAAGSDEFSWESGDHGIFTRYLLEAGGASSKAADHDGDGYLSTTELYRYALLGIEAKWNRIYDETPTLRWQLYAADYWDDYLPHLSGTTSEYALWSVGD